jgi:hypothetical protein
VHVGLKGSSWSEALSLAVGQTGRDQIFWSIILSHTLNKYEWRWFGVIYTRKLCPDLASTVPPEQGEIIDLVNAILASSTKVLRFEKPQHKIKPSGFNFDIYPIMSFISCRFPSPWCPYFSRPCASEGSRTLAPESSSDKFDGTSSQGFCTWAGS